MEIINGRSARKSAKAAWARKPRYVFGAAMGLAVAGVLGQFEQAHAGLITNADFTFEANPLAVNATAGQSVSYPAENGTGTVYGVHAGISTYNAPTGNGSPHCFNSNDWQVGDYYEFAVPTTGIQAILLSFDQISSATGPSQFNLLYSTDGLHFSTFSSYVVTITEAATSWASGTSQVDYNHLFDLSGITALNNDSSALFAIQDSASTPPFNSAGTTSVVSVGTDRIDNVIVAGTPIPEPATLSLLTVAAAGLLMRRRARVE